MRSVFLVFTQGDDGAPYAVCSSRADAEELRDRYHLQYPTEVVTIEEWPFNLPYGGH